MHEHTSGSDIFSKLNCFADLTNLMGLLSGGRGRGRIWGGLKFGMLIVLHIWERIFGGLICRGHINRILPYLVKAQVQACIFTKKYRLNCNCVPMNFAQFFRKAFLQNNADWLLLLNLGAYRGRIEMKILATKMKI